MSRLFTCGAVLPVLAGLLTGAATFNTAGAQESRKGTGSMRAEFQTIRTGRFHDALNKFDYWSTDTRALLLSMDYSISDRVTVFASVPYVKKRFNSEVEWGGDPHNPNDPWWIDFVPPDNRFIDDEQFHGGFQDLSIGFSYRYQWGPLSVSPYISRGTPTNDYPFYGKAAIGPNLWTIPIGTTFSYVPHFSDWYLSGNLAYVISEQPLDINVNYWLAHLSVGYWFARNFSMNVFTGLKYVKHGRIMPWDFTDDPNYGNFPEDFDTEEWYNHDRIIGFRSLNAGLGFDYILTPKYRVSGSAFTGIWAEQSNEIDHAFTMALTYFFDWR